jgi:sialic acid synthase SpsE
MSVHFGERAVGDGHPCFVTFEAGPTHNGVDSAIKLVTAAAEAGADAVKFQVLDPDRLVADRAQLFEYEILVDRETGETKKVAEPLYDLLKRRSLSHDEWRRLKRHADSLGIAFFATVGFPEEVELLAELGCASIKIASADVNHVPLLRQVAGTGMCVQLDTGNASLGEIEAAVDIIRGTGNENIIIHHCPSGYPARLDGINLNIIGTLKRMFPYPIAFSDHSPGWEMDVAAVALGANMVEKTITFDRTTPSVEHIFSLEPPDMARFVETMRSLHVAFGAHRRVLGPADLKRREAIRRSIHVRRDLAPGQILSLDDFDYRRPGHGIAPSEVDRLVGRRLARPKTAGDLLHWNDLGD